MKSPPKYPRWVYLTLALTAFAAGFAAALALTGTRPADGVSPEPPVEVTCRGLAQDPGYYAGRVVRVSTVGVEPGSDRKELAYRRFAALPPVVVLHFSTPVPVPNPHFVVGLCQYDGKVVSVVNCRPD